MDPTSIANTAMDIEDDLMSNFEVVSVTPWARPSLGLDQLASAPEAPPPLF
jgi:hypothetical protein